MSPRRKDNQEIQDSTTDFFLKVIEREKENNTVSQETEKKDTTGYTKTFEHIGHFYNYINQMIDRILSNKFSMLLLSFLMAFALFMSVSGGDILTSPTSGTTLNNVPVEIYGVDEKYEVTGVPQYVQVGLIGPSLDIYSANLMKDYEVYVDFTGLNAGNHSVNLKSRNFPDSLTVMILPDTINAQLLPKVTKNFDLGYQFINEDQMDAKYSVSVANMDTTRVSVRASEETLDRIVKVDACIDVSEKTADFEQEAQIKAYDSQGQEVDVEINPLTTHVKCQVVSYSKTVPIDVRFVGNMPTGYQISNYTLLQENVTIYGAESDIADIKSVSVDVNVDDIRQSTTINDIPLRKAQGINKFSTDNVSITLDVDRVISKTFDQIPIKVLNQSSNYNVHFIGNSQYATVTVTGSEDKISSLTTANIQATINVDRLSVGSHKVKVRVDVDDETIDIILKSSSTATINIERK